MILRILTGLTRRTRVAWLRKRGVQFRGSVWLQAIEIPRNHQSIVIHDNVAIDRGVTLLVTTDQKLKPIIEIGASCYFNRYSMVDASERIVFGSNCMIGPYCYITDHDHGSVASQLIQDQPFKAAPVSIGEDVWIGAHVTILKGVAIGAGAVIGAGSVVTKNVPAGTVVAGVPAKVLRKR